MKVLRTELLPREIGIDTPSPLGSVGDGSAGRAVGQSSGLTHWDPVNKLVQPNLERWKSGMPSPSPQWLGGGSPFTTFQERRNELV